MTQSEIDRAVANVTGETLCEIRRRGFGWANPIEVSFDPEPCNLASHVVDWDELDRQRVALFP